MRTRRDSHPRSRARRVLVGAFSGSARRQTCWQDMDEEAADEFFFSRIKGIPAGDSHPAISGAYHKSAAPVA